MQEEAAEAAAHHPVGGHRRVDAAGHEHHTAAAHPHRQPALPRHPLGEHEHLVLVHLDEHRRCPGWERLTPSPCASWISRPISTPSCPEVSGKRLSRRRARTAKVPDVPLVSAIAAAEIASGVFATRSGRHTRAMPGTSRIRSAIWPTACAQACLAALLAVGDAQQDDPFALAQVDRHAEIPAPRRGCCRAGCVRTAACSAP